MELWKMTLTEYRTSLQGKRVERIPQGYYSREGQIQHNHRLAVEHALQGGQPVSAAILADYTPCQIEIWARMFGPYELNPGS